MAAGCAAALAGPANAKIFGNAGPFIAFDRGGDIRVMSDRGAGVFDVNITNSPGALDSAASWGLPDNPCLRENLELNLAGGRTLVYESRRSGANGDIVSAKLAGNPPRLASTPKNLTATASVDEGAPAVGISDNPVGIAPVQSIVFTRGPVGRRDIWAMGLDGSKPTRLTSAPGDEYSPDWSSDGASVVYQTADAGGRQQLAIIDVAHNLLAPQRFVVRGPPRFISAGPEHGGPSWYGTPVSADADPSRIVHVTTVFGVTYLDFIEQKRPTSGPLFAPTSVPAPLLRQLTGDPGGDLAPSWRPQGDVVVFESDRAQPGNRDVYAVKTDGTGLVRLTRDPAPDRAPDWEPIGGGCLDPEPYSPRPGPKTRGRLIVKNVRVSKGRGRIITVRFSVNRPARATLRLRRARRTVARRVNQRVRAGNARIRLTVPRKARGGRHRLRLTVTAGRATRAFSRNLTIRSRR